jgi:hypothetical protein
MTYPIEAKAGKAEHDFEAEKPFHVVIAYDAPRAAQEAVQAVTRAMAHAGVFGVHKDLWRFDLMDLPAVREEASVSAATANLVVLVARGDAELPPSIKSWLQNWATDSAGEDSALLALFHGNKRSAAVNILDRQFLEMTARQACHDFFTHELQDVASLPGCDLETPAWVPLNFSAAPGEDPNAGRQYRDWGLNE